MTKPLDPYARVYWRVLDDPKFAEIRSDMRHFGSWTLMLVVADMAYPAPAFVPSTVPKASFRKLVECGLIDDLSGGLYRVHGMKSERERRSPRGTDPDPVRTPTGPAPEPTRTLARAGVAEPSKEEPRGSRAETNRRAPRPALLTKPQLEAWESFGSEWDAFKDAWLGRGFMWPPSGSPEDDDGSQRGLLWSILDARPHSLPDWISEAPGRSANEVIGHVIRRWHTIRDDAEATDPTIVTRAPNRGGAMTHISESMPRKAASDAA